MKSKLLECISSPIGLDGEKLFNLTVGETYIAHPMEDGCFWDVTDDYGYENSFFDLQIIFKEV